MSTTESTTPTVSLVKKPKVSLVKAGDTVIGGIATDLSFDEWMAGMGLA